MVGCLFLSLAVVDYNNDLVQNEWDDIKLSNRDPNDETTGLLDKARQAKKQADKFADDVTYIASSVEKTVNFAKAEYIDKASNRSGSGYESTGYGSALLSELDSDHENSKYGINALRRPFF